MTPLAILQKNQPPLTVGSFSDLHSLKNMTAAQAPSACDIAEIRLDLLVRAHAATASNWAHLTAFPLLFTARRAEEGGAIALNSQERSALILSCLSEAAWIDLEVASIPEMDQSLAELEQRAIPWIASYHDFDELPPANILEIAAEKAKKAGASIFKIAAKINSPADLARLAEFQLADHGIAVASMGMGPFAPVSRLLCAQCGSVLNYGYIGDTPTAPGQWDSRSLKQAISRLTSI